MRKTTIRKRLDGSSKKISDKQIDSIHEQMKGISDKKTTFGQSHNWKWNDAVSKELSHVKVRKQQKPKK